MRLLVVEDQERILSFLEKGLRAEGYAVVGAGDAEAALALARVEPPDLAVLDVVLPGRMDGFELLEQLRRVVPGLPVIMLTARSAVEDKVRGLDLGATDYLVKPFAFAELVARVRAHLRGGAERSDVLRAGGIELDLRTREAHVDGETHALSAREFAVLAFLMRHPGHVLSRQQLLSGVWGYDFDPRSNVVDVYIRYLRDKLGAERIETVRGAGYRLRRTV